MSRFEDKGLQIAGAKFLTISRELAERLYETHRGKGFYEGLIHFMTASPVLAVALRGREAIRICRTLYPDRPALRTRAAAPAGAD